MISGRCVSSRVLVRASSTEPCVVWNMQKMEDGALMSIESSER